MKRGLFVHMTVLALVAILTVSAYAGDHEALKVGQKAPDFTLTDFNGNSHTLSGFEGKPVVLVFTSQECPWVRGADADLSAVAAKYADQGVVFVGINSHDGTAPEAIKEYATEKNIPYPIVKDENNVYADKVGATRTPEIFVLNAEQEVVYHGAFDDRKVPEESGETNYLDQALASVVADQVVATKEVKAWGCAIKRVPSQEAAADVDQNAYLANPAPAVSAAVVPAVDGEAPAEKSEKADGCCPAEKAAEEKPAACCPADKAASEKSDACCPADKEAVSADQSAYLVNPAPAVNAAVVPAADSEKAEGCDKAEASCPAKKSCDKSGEGKTKSCPAGGTASGSVS